MGDEEKEIKHINDLVSDVDHKEILKTIDTNYEHQERYQGVLTKNNHLKFDEMYQNTVKDFQKAGINDNDKAYGHKDKILDIVKNRALEYLDVINHRAADRAKQVAKEQGLNEREHFEHVMNLLHSQIGHNPQYTRDQSFMQHVLELVDDKEAKVWEVLNQGIKGNQEYTVTKTVDNYFSNKISRDLGKYEPLEVQEAVKLHLKDKYGTDMTDHGKLLRANGRHLYSIVKAHKDNKLDHKYLSQFGFEHKPAEKEGKVVKMGGKEYRQTG
ncbi:hypothetical protein GF367_01395 [Candidatus Woesearchaeota archaeon]|nr:hypothetical protein [Candidatus Woesearchaeota archaeon]